MRYLFFYISFLVTFYAFGQSELPVGVVVPKIQLGDNPDQTYAIYLPKDYDGLKKYPTVFIFDEDGEGAKVVQQFSIAAALTQSIIIGANYKFNDSLKVSLNRSELLINIAYESYAIDRNKIILAGYGNGALVASASAQLSNDIYGLIVVEDAFLEKKLLQKNPSVKIAILSPDEGRNFYKLGLYGRSFTLKNFVKGFYVYNGLRWPAAGYLSAALTDILLSETTEEGQVTAFYDKDIAFGTLLYRQQQHVYAHDFVNDLRSKYKKKIDIDAQKKLIREIRSNRSYRAKRERTTLIALEEKQLADDFNYYLAEDTERAYFDNLGWWSYQMDALDTAIDSSSTSQEQRKAAIRLKKYVRRSLEQRYKRSSITEVATPEKLLFINVLRTLVNPLNEDAYLRTIGLSAREGDASAALFYLEELLKTGYTQYDLLYEIPYTTALRISPEWNEIIAAYLGKSKYY